MSFVFPLQLLDARVGNHVEIGANTCIDRGSWRDTVIGDHSKIDNLVQVGHNVVVGKSCMLCGQVGIAGSVTIGDYVTFGGRVAVRDHVSIVSKVRLAATSCVTKDIKEPGDYGGFPAVRIALLVFFFPFNFVSCLSVPEMVTDQPNLLLLTDCWKFVTKYDMDTT
ncbi:hypothetical protein I3760_09G083600 [Carya illinoinensis]|nr:hypothetical protein I3760_09G083600 [Carya illinoinensis]